MLKASAQRFAGDLDAALMSLDGVLAIDPYHFAMQRQGMLLFLAATTLHQFFKLPPHVVEGVSQSNIDVFVLYPVHHQLMTRERQVNAHAKRSPLVLMLLQQVNIDPAGNDVGGKGFQLERVLQSTGFQRV